MVTLIDFSYRSLFLIEIKVSIYLALNLVFFHCECLYSDLVECAGNNVQEQVTVLLLDGILVFFSHDISHDPDHVQDKANEVLVFDSDSMISQFSLIFFNEEELVVDVSLRIICGVGKDDILHVRDQIPVNEIIFEALGFSLFLSAWS